MSSSAPPPPPDAPLESWYRHIFAARILIKLLKPAVRILPPDAAEHFRSLPLTLVDIPPQLDTTFRAQFPGLRIRRLRRKLIRRISTLAEAICSIAGAVGVHVEDLLRIDALVRIPDMQRALSSDRFRAKDPFPVPVRLTRRGRRPQQPRNDGNDGADGCDRERDRTDLMDQTEPHKGIE
jgi:hypothetical protein